MMNRITKIAAAVALATLGTMALAADPIKIGVNGPFTGGSSSMGVSMRDGVRLAIDEINKSGGVLGR
ncbi:MAG: ABC transporter substrate-binding protein, partial [Pseudomonadota bacterium]